MTVTKFLARDLVIEVRDAGDTAWLAVGGLNSLTHSPATARADTTGFDSNGREEHIVAQRGETWSLAGFAMEDVSTGSRDAGQSRVEDLGKLRGLNAMGEFRLTSPGGKTITFDASVEVTLAGGGHNDAAAWQAVLTVSGEPVYA
jgi:hypothetical protein